MPHFGATSRKRLKTAHDVLQLLCNRVVKHFDITIIVCHRPEDEQNAAFNSGASTKKWPEGKHNSYPSEAVDVAPWPIPEGWGDLNGKTIHAINLDWKERVKFYEMISAFRFAWSQLCADQPKIKQQYRLRFGADWDGDYDYRDQKFDDLPHIELIEVNSHA